MPRPESSLGATETLSLLHSNFPELSTPLLPFLVVSCDLLWSSSTTPESIMANDV